MVVAYSYPKFSSCRSMLFFGGKTNGLTKGASMLTVLEDRVKVMVSVPVTGLVSMLVSMSMRIRIRMSSVRI